jgi:preprotein translocase subunit YajC
MMTQFVVGDQPPAPDPQANPLAGGSMTMPFVLALVMLFLMVVVFPAQRRQRKEQEKLIATLKRGSKVLTRAGIVGVVTLAKDGEDEIVIRSEDTRLRVKRNAIEMIIGVDEAEANKG